LSGKLNVVADEESRAGPDASYWKLIPSEFKLIQKVWPSKVDLFASHWNAQLPSFFSWRTQPQASGTNAFSVNWRGLSGYLFPPFALIFQCLEKIRRERSDVVLICPVWTGQAWFPVLLELTCDVVLLLHQKQDLVKSALNETHPLLASNALQLAVWRLSGDSFVSADFRQKWSTYLWPEIERGPSRLHTIPHGEIGHVGVCEQICIPCRQI
jgi:hypothetical protein